MMKLGAGAVAVVIVSVGCASTSPRIDPADVMRNSLPTSTPSSAGASASSDSPLRVVVLPTRAPGLDDDERALITRLIAIQLERLRFEVVGSDGCPSEGEHGHDPTDARAAVGLDATSRCLSAAATVARADIAVVAEHARLGDSDVVTVQALDVARGRPARDAAFARVLGEVPPALAPVIDRLMSRALSSFPPLRQPTIRARYEQQRLDVCGDELRWTFCTSDGRAITENDFVRRFRSETARTDLDVAEVDRELDVFPYVMIGGGAALSLVSLGTIVVVSSTPDGQALAQATDDAWVILPAVGVSVALGMFIFGIIELEDGYGKDDGIATDHVLTFAVGRAAVSELNAALLRRLVREAAAQSSAMPSAVPGAYPGYSFPPEDPGLVPSAPSTTPGYQATPPGIPGPTPPPYDELDSGAGP